MEPTEKFFKETLQGYDKENISQKETIERLNYEKKLVVKGLREMKLGLTKSDIIRKVNYLLSTLNQPEQ